MTKRPTKKTSKRQSGGIRPQTKRTSPRVRAIFLAELRKGMSITAAAEVANIARVTVYEWRKKEPDFAQAWDDAVDAGTDLLEDDARRRAVDGCEEPLVSGGKLLTDERGNRIVLRRYSDTLMTLLLKARRPENFRERVSQEFSGPNGGPIQTMDFTDDQRAKALANFIARTKAQPPKPDEDPDGA